MPITQDRFMAVVNNAGKIADGYMQIRRMAKAELGTIVSEANAVLLHEQNSPAANVIHRLLQYVHQLNAIIDESDLIAPELIATIEVERRYFQKNARANDKAAHYQRQARRRMGVPERSVPEREALANMPLKPSDDVFTNAVEPVDVNSPQYQKFLHDMRDTSAAERYAQESAERKRLRSIARANGEPVAGDEVVRTSVPSLAELNKVPGTNEDLL